MKATGLQNGEEQYEEYYSDVLHKTLVQYDYRDDRGALFTAVGKTVEQCRSAKDKWLEIANLYK